MNLRTKKLLLIFLIVSVVCFFVYEEPAELKNQPIEINEPITCVTEKSIYARSSRLENGTYKELCNREGRFSQDYKGTHNFDIFKLYQLTKNDKDYAWQLLTDFHSFNRLENLIYINILRDVFDLSDSEIMDIKHVKVLPEKLTNGITLNDLNFSDINGFFYLADRDYPEKLNRTPLTQKEIELIKLFFLYSEKSYPSFVYSISEPVNLGRITNDNKKEFIEALKIGIKNRNNDYSLLRELIGVLENFNAINNGDLEVIKAKMLRESLDYTGRTQFADLIPFIAKYDKSYARRLADNFYETYYGKGYNEPMSPLDKDLLNYKKTYGTN